MTTWPAQRVPTNNITLNIYRAGAGPTLVLLHGVTDSGMCWIRTANDLVAEYDVILVDARGHGDSDKPPRGYTPDDHAADVAGLIDALGLDRPVLIGHSMGAQTAAVTAATYPDKVRAIVMEDPPWTATPHAPEQVAEHRAGMVNWIRNLQAMTQQEIIAQKREDSPEWAAEIVPPWAAAKLAVSMNIFGELAAMRREWRETVPRIQCPFLLITADTDQGAIVAWETAAEIAHLPNAQTVHIPGAGHNIRRGQYPAFRAAVRAFVDEVVRST